MKNNQIPPNWQSMRSLPLELDFLEVTKYIENFPPEPPPQSWSDYLTLKTKWIMSISIFAVFTYVFFLLSASPTVVVEESPSDILVDEITNAAQVELDQSEELVAAKPPESMTNEVASPILNTEDTIPLISSMIDETKLQPAISPLANAELDLIVDTFHHNFSAPTDYWVNPLIPAQEIDPPLITLPVDSLITINESKKGGVSPHAWASSCTDPATYTQALPPFSKAVVRGKIRVVIRKGDINQMTTFALPGKETLVRAEVKDGVLYLSSPKGADRTFNYDIQLTATDLQVLKVKTKGCVWLDGQAAQTSIKGDGCPTRNFEGEWVEIGTDQQKK